MFEQLKRRTLEVLAERSANYPFDEIGEDEECIDTKEEEYDMPDGIVKLGSANGSLLNALNEVFEFIGFNRIYRHTNLF